ncbi:hemerythrin domain-containing protein [Kitasatospora aureofaciens]|uniref:hemerythrin domain-containing protein n=1 Tax=Kitasatospora aureofaciens TaxID=1894 RepID=UPI000524AAA2|nr:hemerythrin domain-containing protein [Kitasatospora aureofaciens]HJD83251.1 hemerythrin domain-containing protein [Kitasatospora aureofaciens]
MPIHLLPQPAPSVPAQAGSGVDSRGADAYGPATDEEPFTVRFAGLRLVHAALRRDLARLPNALRLLQPDEEDKGEALLRHWTFMTAMLTCHHEQQDTRIWPIVRRFAPELRLLLNWLEADHHNLDHSFTRVTTLVRIASRDTGSAWPVAYAMEDLAARLETHLRIEERQLLPRMDRVVTDSSRLGGLGELLDLLRSADGPGAADALAWLLDGVDPAQVERLLAECDDDVARNWPHWQATYQRCTAPLWGPAGGGATDGSLGSLVD